jgi:lambda family phage tail tape measure protein
MDVAALSLSVDSSDVVKAANDLDRFSAASARAGAASKVGGDGGTKAAAGLSRTAQSAVQAAAMVDKYANSATRAAADAQRMATAANAAGSSLINFGTGVDLVTGKLDKNLVAINRNIAAWDRLPKAVNDNVSQMRANTGNIAAQFQDIGVTSAMGLSPLMVGLQQGTQLAAVFAQTGGSALATIKAAFASVLSPVSLLTIALVAGAAALIQWGIEALTSADSTDKLGDAIKDTQITTYALGDAQTALGGVFDLTTGKIKTQSEALRGLARAQLEVIRATAIKDRADAARTIAEQRGRNTPTSAQAAYGSSMTGLGLSGRTTANEQQRLLDQFTSGKLTSTQAIDGMERLRKAGKLTEEQFIALTGAVASFGVAGENLKVYEDARKALNGDQGALQQFLNLSKTPKGPKSDAEKLIDIYTGAQADIAAQKARSLAEANQLGAFEATKLEKQTALLNAVQQKGIPVTDAVRTKIAGLAEEYAKFKTSADVSTAINGVTDDIQKQRDAIADRTKLVGLYGDALARATREMEAQRRLRESLPRDEVVVIPNLTGGLSDDIEALARKERAASRDRWHAEQMRQLEVERDALGLTGEALASYRYQQELINRELAAGVKLKDIDMAAIREQGDAYGEAVTAIERQRRAIADAREVTRGFFADWINGAREGKNVFTALGDAAVNALNRIIDKLLDRTLDSFLDGLFSNGPGFLGGLLGGNSSGLVAPDGMSPWDIINSGKKFALGGAFDQVQRFAKGGSFTNSVVNTPTLFRFANGAALGEMGEAGPEAIMPLKRGPDGSLGVQMHGSAAPKVRMGDIHNVFRIDGAVTPDMIVSMIQQGGQATYDQIKRDLQAILQQLEQDGTIAT